MQEIKVEALSTTEYQISINVPSSAVDKKIDEFFQSVKNKAQIPGFRKGKAPTIILKQYLGDKAKAPVAGLLASEFYEKAIKENDIVPLGQPTIKNFTSGSDYPGKFGFDNSYEVEFLVEVSPKIDPVGYNGMELDIADVKEDTLVNHRMHEYRDQFAERAQVLDRGANPGDTLIIDFIGYIDNVAFEGGAATGHTLDKLGQANFIPGFEEQLLGTKVGETKKIFVTFPKEYHAKHLEGKDATFDVTVHSIVSAKLAEENDDLAMMVGFSTLDELKAKIAKDAQQEKRAIIRQRMDHQIMTKLLENNKFDAPKRLVDAEYKHIMSRIKTDQLPAEFLGELHKNAEFNVRRALIANAIYEKESSIEVTPEELDAKLEEQARQSNKTKDEVISALYNSNQMDNFVGVIRFTKVIDFIIDNAKQQEKKVEEQK